MNGNMSVKLRDFLKIVTVFNKTFTLKTHILNLF